MSDKNLKESPGTDDGRSDPSLLPARPAEPIPDPGMPEHEPRPTDVDPRLEKRAERQISGLFILAALLSLVFCVCYLFIDKDATLFNFSASNFTLGMTLGLAMLFIGVGAIQWARKLMADQEIVEYRHPGASPEEDRTETLAAYRVGVEESGFGRRPLVRNSLIGAVALLGLPAVIVLGDLGPLPGTALERTVWRKGVRVVNDVSGEPIKPEDMRVGQLVNAEPSLFFDEETADGEIIPAEYEGIQLNIEKTKAAVILVRMEPDDITPYESRADWGVDGILCYSKICTHVGCPISLWEQQTHHLLCPCHQSTFDLADNGKVVFGPAARSLPQLQLSTDDEGYLIAVSDFQEPVGPSYWERG